MTLQERHKIQYLISAAIIFLILGLGNVIYGHAKYKEYKSIYKETTLEINNNLASTSDHEKARHLKRSQGRIGFYQFFVKGGKVFLFISVFIFIIVFVIMDKKDKNIK